MIKIEVNIKKEVISSIKKEDLSKLEGINYIHYLSEAKKFAENCINNKLYNYLIIPDEFSSVFTKKLIEKITIDSVTKEKKYYYINETIIDLINHQQYNLSKNLPPIKNYLHLKVQNLCADIILENNLENNLNKYIKINHS